MYDESEDEGAFALSRDRRLLVKGSEEGELKAWDTTTGAQIHTTADLESEVTAIVILPDNRHVVLALDTFSLILWDLEADEKTAERATAHTDTINALEISSDGLLIASASDDSYIRFWDVGNLTENGTGMEAHKDGALYLTFSPDGKTMFSGGYWPDCSLKAWDVTSRQELWKVQGHSDDIVGLAVSSDSSYVASASMDLSVKLWRASNGTPVGSTLNSDAGAALSVDFSSDGKWLLGGGTGFLCLWNMDKAILSEPADPLDHSRQHPYSMAVSMSSTDQSLVVQGNDDGSLKVWDLQSTTLLHDVPSSPGASKSVTAIAFAPDGRKMVVADEAGLVCVRDAHTLSGLLSFRAHEDAVWSIRYSHDGLKVVTASRDQTIKTWHANTGELLLGPLKGHEESVRCALFIECDSQIVSGSDDGSIRFWDASNGAALGEPLTGPDDAVWDIDIHPTEPLMAAGSADEDIIFWNLATKEKIATVSPEHGEIWAVTFSPDGKHLALAFSDTTLGLWDAHTHQQIGAFLVGHMEPAVNIAFSLDSKEIITGSRNGEVFVWTSPAYDCPATGKLEYSLHWDGWARTPEPEQALLFWVPLAYRVAFMSSRHVSVFGAPSTKVDLTNFRHGTRWTETPKIE